MCGNKYTSVRRAVGIMLIMQTNTHARSTLNDIKIERVCCSLFMMRYVCVDGVMVSLLYRLFFNAKPNAHKTLLSERQGHPVV